MSKQSFKQKYGPWAIVTGASAGIGAEYANQLAAKGLNLVLVARRQEKLRALANELTKQYGVEVRVAAADLTQDDFMSAIEPVTDGLQIGLLVNNAGTGVMGSFLNTDTHDELDILTLNTRAPLVLTKAYVEQMRQQGQGGIIFLSSVAAYQGVPYLANYAATKAYNLLFGEALWFELKDYGIDVLSVVPGGTRTEALDSFTSQAGDGVRFGPMPLGPVETVITESLKALGNRASVIPGQQNRLMMFVMSRLFSRKLRITMMGSFMKKPALAVQGEHGFRMSK